MQASVSDALLLFSAPARFDGVGWGITGGVVAGTGLLMFADDPMRTAFGKGHDSTKDNIASVGNTLGTVFPGSILAVGTYLGGLIFDSPRVRLAGRHLAQALAYSALTTVTLKVVLGRHRPFLGDGPHVFEGPSLHDEYNSLPSGHTTVAFAIGSTLAAEIDHPIATVVLYSAASLTALSRIYSDRHWLSDTFLGAAIGTACGYGVVHLHDPSSDGTSSLLILPTLNGISVAWQF